MTAPGKSITTFPRECEIRCNIIKLKVPSEHVNIPRHKFQAEPMISRYKARNKRPEENERCSHK